MLPAFPPCRLIEGATYLFPPEPSPTEGEGKCVRAMCMKCLPLSAHQGGGIAKRCPTYGLDPYPDAYAHPGGGELSPGKRVEVLAGPFTGHF
jgi:hypothetical protein